MSATWHAEKSGTTRIPSEETRPPSSKLVQHTFALTQALGYVVSGGRWIDPPSARSSEQPEDADLSVGRRVAIATLFAGLILAGFIAFVLVLNSLLAALE